MTKRTHQRKMAKTKTPEIGDMIEHTCTLNGTFKGKVIQLLSMQFIYETKEGYHRHCMFRETWKHIDE